MKKLIAMLLALVMAFAMVACGASENKETEPATEATVEVTEEVTEEVMEEEIFDEEIFEEEIIEGEDAVIEMSEMETLLNDILELSPVEFFGGFMPVDLTDADSVYYYTGLDSAESIVEAAAYEPMMSSLAFSMVVARVAEGADAEAVAESIKNSIDTRKWVCVEANELETAVSGDVVMLIMLDNVTGLNAQSFVDAFHTVRGEQ